MSFIWPEMLVALALIPLGLLLIRSIERRRAQRLAAYGGTGLLSSANVRRRKRLRDRIPALLCLVAFAILAVALARPQAAVTFPRVEGTVLLTFDVSASMSADDVTPTRLEASKAIAKGFVEDQRQGVLIGVVAFSDAGLAVLSPTDDSTAVMNSIDRLAPATGTSVGRGMLASLEVINKGRVDAPAEFYSNLEPSPSSAPGAVPPGSDSSAVIVVFSDGENTVRPDPFEAAGVVAEHGIRVHTVGVATAAGTTLELDGFSVHTRLDENILRAVAGITDGTYHTMSDAPTALQGIYDAMGSRLVMRTEYTEITALLAGAGIVLLMLGGVLSLSLAARLP